jgi:hypothetical protein
MVIANVVTTSVKMSVLASPMKFGFKWLNLCLSAGGSELKDEGEGVGLVP